MTGSHRLEWPVLWMESVRSTDTPCKSWGLKAGPRFKLVYIYRERFSPPHPHPLFCSFQCYSFFLYFHQVLFCFCVVRWGSSDLGENTELVKSMYEVLGTSLAVQWLRPCTCNVGSTSSVPGWGTKILHVLEQPRGEKSLYEVLEYGVRIESS